MPEKTVMTHRQLDSLLPPAIMANLNDAAFELVRAVLIRSTYIPGVRHRLGWRGIHEVVAPGSRPGSITAKINDRPGIFALDPIEGNQGQASRFSLSYFPAPDEQILEDFSIQAGIEALSPDFIDRIRHFNLYPELTDLFHIGFIAAGVEDPGVFLAVQACERLAWNSDQGIELLRPQGPFQAVAPGGIDQNLSALEIAMDFFRPLAAAFTYTLASVPSIFYTQTRESHSPSPVFRQTPE